MGHSNKKCDNVAKSRPGSNTGVLNPLVLPEYIVFHGQYLGLAQSLFLPLSVLLVLIMNVTSALNTLMPSEIIRLIHRYLPSSGEHFQTCSTSPSQSFVNTNRCKYEMLFSDHFVQKFY